MSNDFQNKSLTQEVISLNLFINFMGIGNWLSRLFTK